MFTDIEGSTRLLQRVGEEYRTVLDLHNEILRTCIQAHDGVAVSTEGDSFFAVFASAQAGVDAAVDAQRALAEAAWPAGAVVRVRMGLHTGLGELGGDNYIGLDVHVGARVSAAGHGGQIVMSRATEALLGGLPGSVAVRDLGTHVLKDIERPIQLFQLSPSGLPSDFPPLRTIDARPNNLPVQATPFVGRAEELADLEDLLTHERLVTLTGPGGVGKTRLALHAAGRLVSHFADGVWYVSLGPLTDPDLVAAEVAVAISMPEHADRPLEEALGAHLRDLEVLLVLDNFEHLLPAAPTVARWLEQAPGVCVLVTSRAVLRVRGEREFPVPPLSALPADTRDALGDAVDLFVRRAYTVDPNFELTDANAPIVGAIVERIDRLPLAIELAASRLKIFSPEQLLERLDGRLDVLKGGRDLPERQRTLRGSIEWSVDMLDPDERATLGRLSAFRSGFTIEAAEDVVGDDLDVADGLAGLIDQSLIRATPMQGRFEMLRTIRDHAEALLDPEERHDVGARHAQWAHALAIEAGTHLEGGQRVVWFDRLDVEHDNIRKALGWLLKDEAFEEAAAIAGAMWRFWQVRGRFVEGLDAVRAILALPGATARSVTRAEALMTSAHLTYWQGNREDAERGYREALEIFEELGHEDGVTDALYNLSFTVGFSEADDTEARAFEERAFARMREAGDERRLALIAIPRSFGLVRQGRVDEAREVVESAVNFFSDGRDTFGQSVAFSAMATFAAIERDFETSAKAVLDALDVLEPTGDVASMASLLELTGLLQIIQGDAIEGAQLIGGATSLRDSVGYGLDALSDFVGDPRDEAKPFISAEQYDVAVQEGLTMDVWDLLERGRRAARSMAEA